MYIIVFMKSFVELGPSVSEKIFQWILPYMDMTSVSEGGRALIYKSVHKELKECGENYSPKSSIPCLRGITCHRPQQ